MAAVDHRLMGEDKQSINKNVKATVNKWEMSHPDERLLTDNMKRTVEYCQKKCACGRIPELSCKIVHASCTTFFACVICTGLTTFVLNTGRNSFCQVFQPPAALCRRQILALVPAHDVRALWPMTAE